MPRTCSEPVPGTGVPVTAAAEIRDERAAASRPPRGGRGELPSTEAVRREPEGIPGSDVAAEAQRPEVPAIDDEPLIPASAAAGGARSNWTLVVLTTLALLGAGYLARAVIMPVAFALLLTLTLRPVVRHLKRRGLPLPAGTAAVLLLVIAALLIGITYLVGPAKDWIDTGPEKLKLVGERLSPLRNQWQQIQEASEELEDLAQGTADEKSGAFWDWFSPAERDSEPVAVEVRQPRLASNLMVLNSAGSFLAATVVTFVLAFFLLSAGDVLINNVLRILPSMREKRNAVELVHNVEQGISSYLFTVTCINVVLGVVQGVAMWLLGMPNPALWGAMCCVLNFIPYLGALIGTIVVFLVAVLTFDTLAYAALVPATYFAITALEGNLFTPAILGRSMSLNPVMVFLFLTFWGWMWGIGGALLAVPLLAMLKIGFDQFERTKPMGTLLGG
jgi:predicted PurR-regulated permease PerM